jgi:hypothetical protein
MPLGRDLNGGFDFRRSRVSLGDVHLKANGVVSAHVLDHKLVLPILRWCDLHGALRAGRIVFAHFFAGRVVDIEIHVSVFLGVRSGLERRARLERHEVCDFSIVLQFDLLALEVCSIAQARGFHVRLPATQRRKCKHRRGRGH